MIQNYTEVVERDEALLEQLEQIEEKFKLVINYNNFHLADQAGEEFFVMVKRNQKYFLSSIRYFTNAFFR